VCREEYSIAQLRHREENRTVLVPVFLRNAALPSFMRLVNYIDCRESDQAKLRDAAARILAEVH
jgi:hypothetical protein